MHIYSVNTRGSRSASHQPPHRKYRQIHNEITLPHQKKIFGERKKEQNLPKYEPRFIGNVLKTRWALNLPRAPRLSSQTPTFPPCLFFRLLLLSLNDTWVRGRCKGDGLCGFNMTTFCLSKTNIPPFFCVPNVCLFDACKTPLQRASGPYSFGGISNHRQAIRRIINLK